MRPKFHSSGDLLVARVPGRHSPARLLSHVGFDDRPFVLLSGPGDAALTRWSYGALEPIGPALSDLDQVEDAMRDWAEPSGDLPPLCGGAIGYQTYDGGWSHQARPRKPRPDPFAMPHRHFRLFDAVYALNEATGEGLVVCQASGRARAERLVDAVLEEGTAPVGALTAPLRPLIPRSAHLSRIERALEYIAAGEIYQVNLTYPLVGDYEGAPGAAFLRLITQPPPGFAAFIRVSESAHIVSASPECFFDFDASTRAITTYPIKGTRRRSEDRAEDRALAESLQRDEKERAEHLMIVDLLRNDIGRIAIAGSVRVDGLAYVESFPSVHHLTSRIRGTVAPSVSAEQIFEVLSPGGSITGAPKLRAMEIIDELEGEPRGVYTGAIGYVTPGGSIRTSIAIRTAQIVDGKVRFGVGGGIVHDSVPEREWEETELKAVALSRALAR